MISCKNWQNWILILDWIRIFKYRIINKSNSWYFFFYDRLYYIRKYFKNVNRNRNEKSYNA